MISNCHKGKYKINANKNPHELFNFCKMYLNKNPAVFDIVHLFYVRFKEKKFYPGCDVLNFLNIQDAISL